MQWNNFTKYFAILPHKIILLRANTQTVLLDFLNKKGEKIVETRFLEINKFNHNEKTWALVKIDNNYGFLDKKGDLIVNPKYSTIGRFDEYRKGWAQLSVNHDKFGFLDEKGR